MRRILSGILLATAVSMLPQVSTAGAISGYFDKQEETGAPECNGAGNPMHVGTGNKYQPVNLYRGSGTNPLEYTLHFNSDDPTYGQFQAFGQNGIASTKYGVDHLFWRDSFSAGPHWIQVSELSPGDEYAHEYYYRSADGSLVKFGNTFSADASLYPEIWGTIEESYSDYQDYQNDPSGYSSNTVTLYSMDNRHKADITIIKKNSGDTGFINEVKYYSPDGTFEYYDRATWDWQAPMSLDRKEFPNGDVHDFTYDSANNFVRVEHNNGETLYLDYETGFGNGRRPIRLHRAGGVNNHYWDIEYATFTDTAISSISSDFGASEIEFKYKYWQSQPNSAGKRNEEVYLTDMLWNGEHYAGWIYDEDKERAYISYHGPGTSMGMDPHMGMNPFDEYTDKFTYSYYLQETGPTTSWTEVTDLDGHDSRTVINQLGMEATYYYTRVDGYDGQKAKLQSITGAATTNCLPSNTTLHYDWYYRVSSVEHPSGETIEYDYAPAGYVDARSRLSRVTRAKGSSLEHLVNYEWYDHDKGLLDLVERPGLTTDYDYYANGRLKSVTNRDTTTGSAPYSTFGNERTWTYHYTYGGASGETVVAMTVDGPRTDVADTTTYRYDLNGHLTSVESANSNTIQFQDFNSWGIPEEILDENGELIHLDYKSGLNEPLLTSIELPGQAPLQLTYNSFELPETVTYPSGLQLTYHYKTGDRESLYLIESNTGDRLDIDWSDDTTQNIRDFVIEASESSASQSAFYQRRQEDALGRLYRIYGIHDNGSGSEYTEHHYTAAGDFAGVSEHGEDATGTSKTLETERTYDVLRRLDTIVAPAAGTTDVSFDTQGRLEGVEDAELRTTVYQRNGFGEAKLVQSPDSGDTTFYYDSAGNVVQKVDARGKSIVYGYDALNRLTSVDYPEAGQDVVLRYDESGPDRYGQGRLTSLTDAHGIANYYYYPNGKLRRLERTIDGVAYETAYTYVNGLLDTITYPSGRVVDYDYDAFGRVSRVVDVQGGQETELASQFDYLPFGPMDSVTYGNGLTLDRTFNSDYSIQTQTLPGVLDLTYHYDGFGNIRAIDDSLSPAWNQVFAYDDAHRLEGASGGYGDLVYGYDLIGNRLDETRDSGANTRTYNYSNASHLESITGSNAVDYDYDEAGNTVYRNGTTFGYNSSGRLVSVSGNGVSASYAYNVFGQRIIKDNGVATHFHYDQQGRLLAETDAQSGEMIREYAYVNGEPLAVSTAGSQAEQLHYVHSSHLGAPLALTDESGQVSWSAHYEPFGKLHIAVSSLIENRRFPGQYRDSETGLHYNYFRYYDSDTGRYLRSDPIGLAGGINTYAYAWDNPLRYTDPDGLFVCAGACVAGGAIAVGRAAQIGYRAYRAYTAYKAAQAAANVAYNESSEEVDDDSCVIDDKIKDQLGERGWTEEEIDELVKGKPSGSTSDNRGPKKTPDGKGRNDPASVYGDKDGYVVVNDRTREVVQVSDRTPGSGWVPDSRIEWK